MGYVVWESCEGVGSGCGCEVRLVFGVGAWVCLGEGKGGCDVGVGLMGERMVGVGLGGLVGRGVVWQWGWVGWVGG